MDDILRDFLSEAAENIAILDEEIVRLDSCPNDPGLISSIFRLVHTVKGTCGFLGLTRLEKVAHAGENVLGRIRDNKILATPDTVTAILAAIDRIKLILANLSASKGEGEGDDAPLIAMLETACAGEARSETVPAAPSEVSAALAGVPPQPGPSEQTIRVKVDLLENLMTTVSELVLTRNQILQVQRQKNVADFTTPLQRLNTIVSELQDGVMKARMQPVSGAWGKLPRLIRDLAQDLGKKITLEMRGAETELDRQVLELIKDPLTHMVRNCADHGLETPAERLTAGKSEVGHILLNAYHQGGHIIIDIGDDGRGLDADRIRRKVVEKGLATEAELLMMSDAQLFQFIFHAGFSTAETVTAVSGRGVGMDVVRTNIEKIGGTIDLHSAPGKGSTFQIKIPLTLAIVSALIIEAGGERYAIPQTSVSELVLAHGGSKGGPQVDHVGDAPVLRLREQLLPLVRLGGLLGLEQDGWLAEQELNVVIATVDGAYFGIVVDRVFDIEEIVVKPVSPILQEISVFSGNTILGDGSVIMILDGKGLLHRAGVARQDPLTSPIVDGEKDHPGTSEKILIARTGDTRIAIKLKEISRLEESNSGSMEIAQGQLSLQYRDQLMPLVQLGSFSAERQPILVFAIGHQNVGLIVDEVVDIVDDVIELQWNSCRPGLLGSAVIAGRVTDFLDVAYHTAPFADNFASISTARSAA